MRFRTPLWNVEGAAPCAPETAPTIDQRSALACLRCMAGAAQSCAPEPTREALPGQRPSGTSALGVVV